MTLTEENTARMLRGLEHDNPSVRLRTVMAVGTNPDVRFVEQLVGRCATEPDFSVREALTWALTRHPASVTVPLLVGELDAEPAQARSQALHTLSKIGDPRAWPAIGETHLTDGDDEVARSAWRAAAILVPEGEEPALAAVLATQLGRGGHTVRLSLSRALIALGEAAVPVLHGVARNTEDGVREHAIATERLMRDPEAGFAFAVEEAKRVVALGPDGQEGRGGGADR
ncbi:HEAT repeat domain-containing protein [Streptomyces sp. NPDC003691]